MSVSSDLFDILLLRSNPQYYAAEVRRRQIGADAMASAGSSTLEYAGVRLLIGTWETIALRVKGNAALKVPFYETNPVGHMWEALWPGIKVIRGGFKGRVGLLYAHEFQALNRAYVRWLADKPVAYRTAAMQGINAQFG
jgi:hypothetical protein